VQHVFAENLELNDLKNIQTGRTVEFNLTINNAPNEVGAFGFEIAYNPEIFSYQSYEIGQTFKNRFDNIEGNQKENGILIFGGYSSSQRIEQGESGILLTLSFNVLKAEKDTIVIQKLIDNFKGWSVRNGLFNQESVGLEDIDNDGKLGLAEVIYLLQILSGF
jgi:hypothetical protein